MTSEPPTFSGDPSQLSDLVRKHAHRTGSARLILGLAGGPGAGKSTLAGRLAAELAAAGESVAVVPADGFVLSRSELRRLNLTDLPGAPETFDVAGYLALLQRIRAGDGQTIYAPMFVPLLEEPVAGSIPIAPDVRYVITEGSYLLFDVTPWPAVRALLDATWFLDPGADIRINRLVRRHIQAGRPPNNALRRATSGQEAANAALIAETRHRADLVVEF